MSEEKPVEELSELDKIFNAIRKSHSRLEKYIREQDEKLEILETKLDKVILSEENANRQGSKLKLTDDDILWLKQQRDAGRSVADLAGLLAISRQTVYNYLKKDYAERAVDRELLGKEGYESEAES